MINLFLVDKQPTFIKGLLSIFEEEKNDVKVVGIANSCKESLDFLNRNKVHIILLDPSINNSFDNNCLEKIKNSFKNIKIIILTNDLDINYLNNLWNAGVDGIELKNCGKKALLHVITSVMQGQRVIGKEIPDFSNETESLKKETEPKLSFKEKQIYQLMLSVNSYDEIAKKLKLPLIAVKFHCKNIIKKINKSNFNPIGKELREKQFVN